jgi:hypothetical protein
MHVLKQFVKWLLVYLIKRLITCNNPFSEKLLKYILIKLALDGAM